ncbi:MAG TPA: pantoate--beta-alanine ligase [Candidatus Limnocylindria bacterium]|nr:pantoate--beta-alanine ligase [Candidatus Limnocylindria bacterium]
MSGEAPPPIARSVDAVRAALAPARERGDLVGLVPTMGALHEGHLALMRAAREACDLVVVSLFVNPAQFGPGEDLARYPRDEAGDAVAAAAAGVDLLFAPSVEEIYPPGFDTWIDPGALGTVLEGAFRPTHFRGVATVCTRLFGIVRPALAYFGRKDAQQVAVLRQVVRDLALPLEIVARPTVRDPDGLALSSRNRYLSDEERRRALALPRALQAGLAAHRSGGDPVAVARSALEAAPGLRIDYVERADLGGDTLAAAVRVGDTRLIDNVLLLPETDVDAGQPTGA